MSERNEPFRVRFICGPDDGLTMPWHDDQPPPSIRLPVKPSWGPPALRADQGQTDPLLGPPDSLYYLARDERGYPSRADDGALQYRYHSTA